MYNSFLQLLSATLAPTAQANFLGLLGIYTCAATPAIARAAAYQQMWRMLAPGVNSASVRILFGFGRMALAGAGVGMEVIAGAYAAMAAFMAGTGGMVILIILIALLILVLLWLAFNMYQDWMKTVQTRQRQQNDELERNTKKLFSSSWLSYSALANDQVCGPVYPIRYQKLQPGCSVG
jgi:small-conductance mechanosensitive channel